MQIKTISGKKDTKIQLLRSKYDTDVKRGKQESLGVFPHDKRLSEAEMDQLGLTDAERQQLDAHFSAVEAKHAAWVDNRNAEMCHENLQKVCRVLKKGTEMSQEKLAELQRDVEELKQLLHRRGMKKKLAAVEKATAPTQDAAQKNDTETTPATDN